MAELKTKPTNESVKNFLNQISDEERRADCFAVAKIMEEISGEKPKMWGPSIVGYGSYRYKYDSGREGEICRAGFSPRKAALTLYLVGDYGARQAEADALFARLGQHSAGKACLYVKALGKVDLAALEGLIALSWELMNERYS